MLREWFMGTVFVLLLAGIFLGGFATHAFIAPPHRNCFEAWEATGLLVRKMTGYDGIEHWVVKVIFAPTDGHRLSPVLEETPRTRHMTFYSDGGELDVHVPMNMAFWSTGGILGVSTPLRVRPLHD
jgi:hypothetical protein